MTNILNREFLACEICANPTRLVAIEPHPEVRSTDLRTFECLICNHVQVSAIPVALNGELPIRIIAAG